MAYTDIDKPSDYFETVLYAGNSGTQSITSLDFQPDWCWFKARNNTDTHAVFDSVRGVTKRLIPDNTTAEGTQSNGLTHFLSNGFTVADAGIVNQGYNYVAWNWKESADAGFDIVAYTGNGSNRTISHNLGAVPKMMIVKERDNSNDWKVYHHSIGNGKSLRLDTTAAQGDDSTAWNSTTPTSSVFSVGTSNAVNRNGGGIIAYLFADKQGYSKFGSYTGNGNADGTFVYTGFKPAFVMVKNTGVNEQWSMHDNKRNDNVIPNYARLTADDNQAESTNTTFAKLELFSNGFKLGNSADVINDSGVKFIYMAFAENPFVTSTGVPATAR